MNKEIITLIKYRMERAFEALDEATMLITNGHSNTFVNRLYYACFYAATALLLAMDFSSSKHSGVRALFHKEVIKPGIMDQDYGKLFDRFFDTRQKADYADLIQFDPEEVRPWYNEAEKFVNEVNKILQEEYL